MKSRWYDKISYILAMPVSKKIEIKRRFSTSEQQLQAFVEYIHSFHPRISWDMLAGVLYSMEEHEALEKLTTEGYLTTKKGTLELD